MDTGKISRYITPLLLAILLGAIFLFYTSALGIGDSWFHLNNGRWIVENGKLPTADHFTHTASSEPSVRKTLILQAYWLSQSFLYVLYKAAGFSGVVAVKALLFTLVFFLLYLCLRDGGLPMAASAIAVAPVAVILREYGEVRPHMFSFLMCMLVFLLLERAGRKADRGWLSLVLLPACMALWSNLHPGFVIGMGMAGIYLLAESIRFIRRGKDRDIRSFGRTALWLMASILAVGLNPNGFRAVIWTFSELGQSPFVAMIDEYLPTHEYARLTGDYSLLAGMAVLGALTSLALLFSWRRLRLEHLLLYICFGYAAYRSYRFCPFFGLISVGLAGQYVMGLIPEKVSGIRASGLMAQASLLFMAVWVMASALGSGTILRDAVDSSNAPAGAVATIRSSALPGALYNPYEWGGYIGWWLYPRYPVFVDERTVDLQAQMDYTRAKEGSLSVLKERGVNTVVFYTLDPLRLGGGVPGIVIGLLKDPSWGLVYFDDISAVFVRRPALERRTMMLGKELLWEQLEERLDLWAKGSPDNHRPYAELGALYAARGMREMAIKSLNISQELSPGNAEALRVFNRYGIRPGGGI